MHSATGNPDKGITLLDPLSPPHRSAIHCAYSKPGQVVFSQPVCVAHFGDLAAHERAANLAALAGHPPDDLLDHRRVHLIARQVVEEEQWLRTLAKDVVYDGGNEVAAGPFMGPKAGMQFHFCADAIRAAYQHRLLRTLEVGTEGCAEASDAGEYRSCSGLLGGTMRAFHLLSKAFDRLVLCVDAHSALLIG
jgi:hypothetical protein